jgi:aspartate 1-decarboxylase
MNIRICMAKIHRATVTGAELNYSGSITIDQALLEASGIRSHQMVMVNNLSNGVSWQTYVIVGEKGKGEIILNGPPARLFQPGDKVIILAEAFVDEKEFSTFESKFVFVDENNKVTRVDKKAGQNF